MDEDAAARAAMVQQILARQRGGQDAMYGAGGPTGLLDQPKVAKPVLLGG
jgi:hypothetical protein